MKRIQLAKLSLMLGMAGFSMGHVAVAVAADDTGWYIGGNVGQSTADIDAPRIKSGLQAGGLTTTDFKEDERNNGFKLFGGYQFNRYLALEGGYFDLGEFSYVANTLPTGTVSGNLSVRGVNLDLVGLLPFTDKFSAFARAGVTQARTRDKFSATGFATVQDPERSKSNTGFKVGVGIQYALVPSLGLRVEAERFRIDDAVGSKGDINLVSIGLLYRFGKGKAAPAQVVEEPVAAPAPKPAAPVRVVVPVSKTQEYCSILDIQFEINRDEVQREEKEKLAVVGTFMQKYPQTTALIEGHSDNIGVPESNQQLSQRRADGVVNYLQQSYQIEPARLSAIGYGDSRPIADNATEEGKRQNRRINAVIACASDIEGLTVAPARMTVAMEMEFDKNNADVRAQYAAELHKVAVFLKANPSTTATVEGHSSNADADLAQELSLQRARNVVNHLVEKEGIAASRLKAEGFGESRNFAYNTSAEGKQDNRRVNIIINYAR